MKSLGLSLLAISLLVAFVPASWAQEAGQTTFAFVTHTEGSGGYFTIEGQTERNPTLVVPASSQITITIKAADSNLAHNVCVASDKCSASDAGGYVAAAGENATLTFSSGNANGIYFCLPHKAAGMTGTYRIAGSAVTTDDEGKDSPGLGVIGVVVALAGAVLLFRRK